MAIKLAWTINAKEDLEQIISYLKTEWSLNSAIVFKNKLLLRIELISKFPRIGKPSGKGANVRVFVIT